jgi:UDP-glucose 4-epimerase
MDKKIKIFITGATGFIGRFLVEELCSQGYLDITVLARRSSNTGFLKSKGAKIIFGDIADESLVQSMPGGYDVVFHCAGFVSNSNKKTLNGVNIRGTENLCRWASKHKVKKFIYLSSVAVNSGNKGVFLTEDKPYMPTNRYGVSKAEAERIAVKFSQAGLPMVIVRPCMVYGEGEPHMMKFLTCLIRSRVFFIPNRGSVKWHLVSVRNVAACLIRCMEDDRALGATFNIADKEVLSAREVFEVISQNIGSPTPFLMPDSFTKLLILLPIAGKHIKFFCKDRVYSIEKLEKNLDFVPPYQVIPELARAAASFCNKI